MKVNATEHDFVAWIAEGLRIGAEEAEDSYVFDLNRIGIPRTMALPKQVLEAAVAQLCVMEEVEETVIAGPRYYETLVRDESTFQGIYIQLRDDALSIDDRDNGIRYKLSLPSNEYLLFLLYKISAIAGPRALVRPGYVRYILGRRRADEIQDVFDLLRHIIPRFLTLRLETDRHRSLSDPDFCVRCL
jgi:hypothetical protein